VQDSPTLPMCVIFATIVDFRSQKTLFPIALNRRLPPYERATGGFPMCLRDGVEAATWVGFSAATLLALITPIIFLI
jgi:hypothetical protein